MFRNMEANSTPLLRTTTEVQNPSEPAAVVSFRDDDIKWGRIEVKLAFRALLQASSGVFNVGTNVGRGTEVSITYCFI